MFNVHFISEDNRKESWLVDAKTEREAINAVLNKTKTTNNPKFVVVEKPVILALDSDLDLLDKCESRGGEYSNVYKIENKLSKVIDIGGISIRLGSLADFEDIVKLL